MLTVTILLIGQPPLTARFLWHARAAGLGKYGYGNGFTVIERISGTVLQFMKPNAINVI